MSTVTQPAQASGRHQRSVKNYLLDPAFQLKYTGFLVLVAVVLSGGLGAVLWTTSQEVLSQSRAAVTQGQETVKRGKELVKTSQDLSKVVQMNIAEKYADNPETAALFNQGAEKKAQELVAEQKRLEEEAARLDRQAQAVELQQSRVLLTLVAALSLLVFFIGIAGIIVTHKVAGPIFKMKRQFSELGQGKLQMPSKLRKGDELVDFFTAFEDAVARLRARQAEEVKQLDQVIASLEASGVDASKLKPVRALREQMQAELG
jgi:nitrogen fixation/metabolism regulation signal transduction histidine kinase